MTAEHSIRDRIIWSTVAVLLLGGFVANHYTKSAPLALQIAGWIVLAGVLSGIALQTAAGKRFWHFAKEAREEMRKVVWPSRDVTVRMTLFVIGIVFLFAILMWGIDSVLVWLVNKLTGT